MMTIIKIIIMIILTDQYDEDSNATHQRTYHVDDTIPSDTYPEDDKNIKDKIVDKLKKDSTPTKAEVFANDCEDLCFLVSI